MHLDILTKHLLILLETILFLTIWKSDVLRLSEGCIFSLRYSAALIDIPDADGFSEHVAPKKPLVRHHLPSQNCEGVFPVPHLQTDPRVLFYRMKMDEVHFFWRHMEVSINGKYPWIFHFGWGFSLINHPFWGTTICGYLHMKHWQNLGVQAWFPRNRRLASMAEAGGWKILWWFR